MTPHRVRRRSAFKAAAAVASTLKPSVPANAIVLATALRNSALLHASAGDAERALPMLEHAQQALASVTGG